MRDVVSHPRHAKHRAIFAALSRSFALLVNRAGRSHATCLNFNAFRTTRESRWHVGQRPVSSRYTDPRQHACPWRPVHQRQMPVRPGGQRVGRGPLMCGRTGASTARQGEAEEDPLRVTP
jgi:hypothetical protein